MSKLHHYLFITLAVIAVLVSISVVVLKGHVFKSSTSFFTEKTAQTSHDPADSTTNAKKSASSSITIRDAVVHVDVVSKPDEMEKGLSGRESLAKDSGMFFIFGTSGVYGIWMPDMHFSIDVLWFNEQMKIVYIVENMSPKSYPKVFTPTAPARYILEVPAGFVKRYGVKVGDKGELSE